MAAKEVVIVQFKPEGDQKLIKAIQKLAVVQDNLNKENKKLVATVKNANSTYLKLTTRLKEQGKTWEKIGVSTKTVTLAMKGNVQAVEKLRIAYKKASTQTRILGGSFAVARSKLLIYSFAAGLVSKLVLTQVNLFAKQEESVARLARVFGSKGAKALGEYSSQLQKVTTFGDEDINMMMAQIGAFGASEEQTKKLAKATLDLSAGMGIGLNEAGKLVAKSIGTSTNALQRHGVELDTNASKSEKVDSIVSGLEATYGGLAEQMAQTTAGQLQQAQNAFGDFQETIGELLAPAVLVLAKGLKAIAEALSNKAFQTAVVAFAALGASLWAATSGAAAFTGAVGALKAAYLAFSGVLAATPWGAALLALTVAGAAAFAYFKATEDSTDAQDKNNKSLKEAKEAIDEMNESRKALAEEIENNTDKLAEDLALVEAEIKKGSELNILEKAMITSKRRLTKEEKNYYKAIMEGNAVLNQREQDAKDALEAEKEIEKEKQRIAKEEKRRQEAAIKLEKQKQDAVNNNQKDLKTQHKLIATQIKLGRELTSAEKAQIELGRSLTEQEKTYYNAIDTGNQILEDNKTHQKNIEEVRTEMINQGIEMISEWSQAQIDSTRATAEAEINAINERMNFELDTLRQSTAFRLANDKQKQKAQDDIRKKAKKEEEEVRKKANEQMKDQFKIQQAIQISETIMATSLAVMKTLAKGSGFFSTPLAMAVAGMGAAQVAMIASQKPPKMKYGGLIGGEPHSRGGTIIEAERGEFVMSKKAVDAVGLETMNRINAGGSSGDVNISFAGNVMSKDFIEDEAIPQIKEALRRGGDIGIN
jgi:hypothetical protein